MEVNQTENIDYPILVERDDTKDAPAWPIALRRANGIPLDRSSIFYSYYDAIKYAKGDGEDTRQLGSTAYAGQIITILGYNEDNNWGSWVYKLVPYYDGITIPNGYNKFQDIKDKVDSSFKFIIEPVGIETESITDEEIIQIVNNPITIHN